MDAEQKRRGEEDVDMIVVVGWQATVKCGGEPKDDSRG